MKAFLNLPQMESIPGLATLIDNHRNAKTIKEKAMIEQQIIKLRPPGMKIDHDYWVDNYINEGPGIPHNRNTNLKANSDFLWEKIESGIIGERRGQHLVQSARKKCEEDNTLDFLSQLEKETNEWLSKPSERKSRKSKKSSIGVETSKTEINETKLMEVPDGLKTDNAKPEHSTTDSSEKKKKKRRRGKDQKTNQVVDRKSLKERLKEVVLEFLNTNYPDFAKLKEDLSAVSRIVDPLVTDIDAAVDGCVRHRLPKEVELSTGVFEDISTNSRRQACRDLEVPFSKNGIDWEKARSHFIKKVKAYHPDYNPGNPYTRELYERAVRANEVLRVWKREIEETT